MRIQIFLFFITSFAPVAFADQLPTVFGEPITKSDFTGLSPCSELDAITDETRKREVESNCLVDIIINRIARHRASDYKIAPSDKLVKDIIHAQQPHTVAYDGGKALDQLIASHPIAYRDYVLTHLVECHVIRDLSYSDEELEAVIDKTFPNSPKELRDQTLKSKDARNLLASTKIREWWSQQFDLAGVDAKFRILMEKRHLHIPKCEQPQDFPSIEKANR